MFRSFARLVPLGLITVLVMVFGLACGDEPTQRAPTRPYLQPTEAPTKVVVPTIVVLPTPTKFPTPTSTPKPVPTPPPDFVTSSAPRLIVSVGPAPHEENLPWMQSNTSTIQLRPMYETLVNTDLMTAGYEARLAAKWSMSSDAKTWSFTLQDGVEWHKGFGTFTSADVKHSWERIASKESIASDKNVWAKVMTTPDEIEIVDDLNIVFKLNVAEPDLEFDLSSRLGNLVMVSKAQWDQVGRDGMRANPAGTGSYSYVERASGAHILYSRVENHWRRTPDFKELMIKFVLEPTTRLASLITKETHIATLPRDLHGTAQANGSAVITAVRSGAPAVFFFGGMFHESPEFMKETPMADVRVREAMVRAIDRFEMIDTLFDGGATPAWMHYNHATQPGWDPEWEVRGPLAYGFDPEKSKALLAEAGYPNGFDVQIDVYPWSSFPEFIPMEEAIAQYWTNIGLNVTLNQTEFAQVRAKYRVKDNTGSIYGFLPGTSRPPHKGFRCCYKSRESITYSFESKFIDDKLAELDGVTDAAGRHEIQRAIGEHMFTNYASMPLLYIPFQVVVNPDVVAEYIIPGTFTGISHLEYIKAAK